MLSLIVAVILSFVITHFSIPAIIKIAKLKKLNDIPSERKLHQTPIPALGGISIFIALVLSITFFIKFSDQIWIQYFLGSLLIIFFLGLKEDLIPLTPYKKFAGQIIAIFVVMYFGDISIHNLFGFLGLQELSHLWSNIITLILFLGVINSFNLIDGVDGLAGTLGLITAVIFGFFFYKCGNQNLTLISFCLASSLFAFLRFNYSPAKIFLGDTGSMIIGFVNAVLAIELLNSNITRLNEVSVTNIEVIVFSMLFIPFFDTARVFFIRILKGKSPFHPDLNHIHHLLLAKGLKHKYISISLGGASIFLVFIGFTFQSLGINLMFSCFLLFGLISVYILQKKTQ